MYHLKYGMDPNNHYLENCLKLKVSKVENSPYKRGEIMSALKQVVENEDFLEIDMVSMYGSNLVWIISFKDLSIARKYFGEKVQVKGHEFSLEDAHDNHVYSTYRICWLPNLLPLDQIVRYFSVYGNVVDCFHETSKEEGCKGIKTGIVQVRLQQTSQELKDHMVKTGPQRLNCGVRMLVLKAGVQAGCWKCGDPEHKAKDCPKNRKPVSYADIANSESNDGHNDADAEHALEQVQPAVMDTNEQPENQSVIVETLNEEQHSTMIEATNVPTSTGSNATKAKRKEMSSPNGNDQTSKQGRQDESNSSYQDYSSALSDHSSSETEDNEEVQVTLNGSSVQPPDTSTPPQATE